MDVEGLVETLYEECSGDVKKMILDLLIKHMDQVQYLEDQYSLPLLAVEDDQFILLFRDEQSSFISSVFYEENEILFVLDHLLKENKTIYFYSEKKENQLSEEDIWRGVHESLQHNDPKLFQFYSNLLQR